MTLEDLWKIVGGDQVVPPFVGPNGSRIDTTQ